MNDNPTDLDTAAQLAIEAAAAICVALTEVFAPLTEAFDHDHGASDVPPTPQAVEAATEWLLDDQAERVETGIVRPASDRAGHLISIVRPLIYREAATRLRALADGMEVVPAGITLEAADRLDLDADEPEHIRDAGHVATRHGRTTDPTDLCPSRVCQATVDREEAT